MPLRNCHASRDLVESYRLNIDRCIALKQDLIKKGIKNIVSIGIGGSFEGPKLLIETLMQHKRNFNHIFNWPDKVEFNETIKPLIKKIFFYCMPKTFSTDETLQSMALSREWLENNAMPTSFIAIT